MKKRRLYGIGLIILLMFSATTLWFNSDNREEKALITSAMPGVDSIRTMHSVLEDPYIKGNFPGIKRVYEVNGIPTAFIVESRGYVGLIKLLVIMDNESQRISQTVILEQGDTAEYADPIRESWFMDRFISLGLLKYLNLVVLEKENPNDIIQVTGATVSSQAVLNDVNAAMGAWQYLINKEKMPAVENAVSQETWEKDDNSFLISWGENASKRILAEDLKNFKQTTVKTVLSKTTGTKTDIQAKGPLLTDVLKQAGVDLSDYQAIGITGRDGYYAMVDKDILTNRQIILGIDFDGKEILKEEKPIRVVIPYEMGVYWVKMVTRIDLYEKISPKNIQNVYIFEALTRDIEPYYYEYYGSKDRSVLVGKILAKFKTVDPNGFFTMLGSDGLEKNETMAMVRDRYYIKIEGDNAPMNIGPAFKLGMNVKEMCCFSTSLDAVAFPEIMEKVLGATASDQGTGVSLADTVLTAGLLLQEDEQLELVDTSMRVYPISREDLEQGLLILADGRTNAVVGNQYIEDVLKIAKTSK